MYLPISPAPLAASSESPAAKWSSTIGIVTAICGNVLISFALNTQRYAHLRLSRDRDQEQEKQRQERKKQATSPGYGTQQSDIAKHRAKANAKADATSYTLQVHGESDETEPLIPALDNQKNKLADSSDDDDDDDESEASTKNKSYLKSPIWWAGIAMMTVGETGNFLAYGFAPASIVSPLGVVALVSNCLIAPWLLHERFRLRDGLGVVIAVAGCVTVVLSASDSNPKLTPDSIWHLITRWEFETYLGITVFLIIILCVASDRFGEKSILIDLGLMGLFGGYTALSTKGVASLLSNTIWRAITFPITYLLVAVLAFTAVMQIKYVNRALQRFNSTQVIPIQFVLFTLSVITGSAVLYRDFERTSTEDAVKFVGGCALTFLGVWCITSGRGDESAGDEETGEEEGAINLLDEEGVQPEIRERDELEGTRQSLIAGSSKLPSDPAPLPNEAVHISPAKAAAIHSISSADLPAEASNPPPLHATTSEPSVPTLNVPPESPAAARPSTPLTRGASDFESARQDVPSPRPPPSPRTQTQTPISTLDPAGNPRHALLKRHSVTLLPGPLTSPLSSSLSAIVADSLRKGVDQFPSTSLRKRPLKLRGTSRPGAERMGLPNTSTTKRHSIASGEIDLYAPESGDSGALRPGTAGAGRMRSLSATLGDMFGSPKRRKTEARDGTAFLAQQQHRQDENRDE